MQSKFRIAFFGYFGYNNIGDDLMLLNMLSYLNEVKENTIIYVFTKSNYYIKDSNFNKFNSEGLRFVKLNGLVNRFFLFYYLLKIDQVWWVGGTCLYEPEDGNIEGLLWLKKIIKKANFFKKPFSFCNIGIGNFQSSASLELTKQILQLSHKISGRDENTTQMACKLNKDVSKVFLGGDLAMLYNLKSEPHRPDRIIGFCGHYQYENDQEVIDTYQKMMLNFCDEGYTIWFVAMHKGDKSDDCFHKKIGQKLPKKQFAIKDYQNLSGLKLLLNKMSIFISMRLHGVVIADMLGIPNIGIAYQPKVGYYVHKTQVLESLRLSKINEHIDKNRINDIIKNYNQPKEFLEQERVNAINGIKALF